jgi:hypothetical protein
VANQRAMEMARWLRDTPIQGLGCHSDARSQFTSVRYGEVLAETVNGYHKAELIRDPPDPVRGRRSRISNRAPWIGFPGTTPAACTATPTTSHQRGSMRRSMLRNGSSTLGRKPII